ncbi:inner centromere protein-like [Aegotheles albertisi]
MAEAAGPTRLLEVCGQRLQRFLRDAEQRRLAWLQEVEEQGVRMLLSNFGAEPELMPKTPSQRRRPRKRQSCRLRDEHKEPTRRRLSRRRSSNRLVSSKPSSQRHQSQEQPQSPGCQGGDVSLSVPEPARPQMGAGTKLPVPPGEQLAEGAMVKVDCWDSPRGAGGSGEAPEAVVGEPLPMGDAAAELHEVPSVAIPGDPTAGEREEAPPRGASTSTPKAARNGASAVLQGDWSPQGLEKMLFQDSESKMTPARSKTRRCSGRRSLVGGPGKSHRGSLAEKYSLASKRENMIRRSISRAMSKKAAVRESSSASSRVSCQSALEVFVEEDVTSSTRTRSYKQAMGVIWSGQQPGGRTLSPLEDKHKSPANQTPPSSSPASKVVRPLKNFLQAMQRNQLLPSPGSAGRGGVVKNFIKHNTPTRPNPKGDFVEKERQRLESLRKKQEAEEQRRKKVEEEKRRRQAEMKQKREERLRKALQARERVEQMEEEKKKRMEQKILQSDEKVHPSHVREERGAEERSKKKLSKKYGEADARKQKVPRVEEDEIEQQEPLQKRREDEVKEKGKKVLELKNLLEQHQVEQGKERDHKQRGREKAPLPQLESAALADKNTKKSVFMSHLGPPKGTKESRSPKGNENNYGMDLNSDDSTDDENEPRKPVPAWADGTQLNQAILHQYYHPVNVDQLFGLIPSPKLEDIFGKSKPRYFKRTSSAVWHSPPDTKSTSGPSCNFKN